MERMQCHAARFVQAGLGNYDPIEDALALGDLESTRDSTFAIGPSPWMGELRLGAPSDDDIQMDVAGRLIKSGSPPHR